MTRPNFQDIPVSKIQMRDRVRVVSRDAVEAIRQSYEDLGEFTTPIHVRKLRGGTYELVDGAHRLTLALDLGLETIPARVWEMGKTQADFFETDANLAISHLTPVALARSLAARQDAYLKLHPETAAGIAGGKARQNQQTNFSSFAEFTGAVMGVTPRQIQKIVRAGRSIDAAQAIELEGSQRRVTLNDLTELAKINEPEERDRVVTLLAEGEVKNAKAARKAYQAETGQVPPPFNAKDKLLLRLEDAWSRAPKSVRRIFLEQYGHEVSALLTEMGRTDD